MKYFGFFVLSAAVACAAQFTTGQAARLIIGQPNFTAQLDDNVSSYILGAVGGVAYANNMLFVVDGNRVQATPVQNRVLVYRNIGSFVQNPTAEIQQGMRCPVCAGSPDIKQADMVLGQPDFSSVNSGLTASAFRTPTSVATNGNILVVTDTDNNRVLIWNSIPQTNNQPADIVLGQADFKTVKQPPVTDNKSFRGPQGVWIQGTRLFVADTQNHRVMVWNNLPTSNNQAADYVLGQPNFSVNPQQNLATANLNPQSNNMLNPVSVTSDGQRLFVTDLGHQRVLIWNSIPTQTQQPADLALGQPDLKSAIENNSPALCASNGTDSTTNKPTYPERCGTTLSFPRFALSDGTRLFIADGGNDHILVYNTMPSQSGARADVILGQVDEFTDDTTDSTDTFRPDANILRSSSNRIRTPIALASDGMNLYVTDPYDRRVLVYTPGDVSLAPTAVVNAFSRAVFAIGTVDFAGTIKENDTVTITVNGTAYKYTIVKADTLTTVVNNLVALINKPPGDPNVFAIANPGFNEVVLSAKVGGDAGNSTTLATSTSDGAQITATASGATLERGNTAAEVAPGTLVTIFGSNLADSAVNGAPDANGFYSSQLGGVEVYFDGIRAPLFYVGPNQVNTQVPFEVQDASAVSAYVVTRHQDGSRTATNAVNIPIVLQNPGVLAMEGQDPRPVYAFHSSSYGTAVVDVGGTIKSGDTTTITVNGTAYNYTVQSADTLDSVRDAFINLINQDANAPVSASAAGEYDRIILTAKTPGPDGNGISVSVTNGSNAQISLTALQTATCCASTAGAPVTADNPAIPGEIISIYATGIGLVQPDAASQAATTGRVYLGPQQNSPSVPVDDAMVGGKTANVLQAWLVPGMVGVYEVQLQLSTDLPDNDQTQLFIAQNVFTSNIVTVAIKNPPSQ
jgi:uncharacterized protein (TIGR03437 family)